MKAMWPSEDAMAPSAQNIAVLVQDNHRMLSPCEQVDFIVAINGDGRDVSQCYLSWQLRPVTKNIVTQSLVFQQHGCSSMRLTTDVAAASTYQKIKVRPDIRLKNVINVKA